MTEKSHGLKINPISDIYDLSLCPSLWPLSMLFVYVVWHRVCRDNLEFFFLLSTGCTD